MKPATLPKIQGKDAAPIIGALMQVKPEKPAPKPQVKKS